MEVGASGPGDPHTPWVGPWGASRAYLGCHSSSLGSEMPASWLVWFWRDGRGSLERAEQEPVSTSGCWGPCSLGAAPLQPEQTPKCHKMPRSCPGRPGPWEALGGLVPKFHRRQLWDIFTACLDHFAKVEVTEEQSIDGKILATKRHEMGAPYTGTGD